MIFNFTADSLSGSGERDLSLSLSLWNEDNYPHLWGKFLRTFESITKRKILAYELKCKTLTPSLISFRMINVPENLIQNE